jgi:hypothetical protein
MTSEKTINRIQIDLLAVSMKLDTLISCIEGDAGKRMVNKLTRLLELTREIANSVTSGLTGDKFIDIYKKASRLGNAAGFVTVKNARLIATELFNIPVNEFNAYLRNAIENGAIDIGRGISAGLEESDAQEYKMPTGGTDFAFYFMIKGKRCE